MGVTAEDFYASFASSITALILGHRGRLEERRGQSAARNSGQTAGPFRVSRSPADPKTRWVDGTPEYSLYVFELWKLFAGAKFIHLLRDVGSVVKSMMNFAKVSGRNLVETEEAAYAYWLRTVEACVGAERALGSERVLRVHYADFTSLPEEALRRCLDFVGEPFCCDCLEPLGTRINSSKVPPDCDVSDVNTDPVVREKAESLSRELLAQGCPWYGPEPEALGRLEQEFRERCRMLGGPKLPKGKAAGPAPNLVDRIREIVHRAVPYGATVLVVSKGDRELLNLYGRRAWHFPQTERGVYLGAHPADSQAAIDHLEMLRARGADFLVFPATAFWWLEFYEGFHQHLQSHHLCIRQNENCIIYRLASGGVR
jgi:hypothetical protein